MVSRLDYTTQLSDSPMVCRGSQQVVTALFEPFSNPPRSDIGQSTIIGAIGLFKPVDTFSSKYNGKVYLPLNIDSKS